MNDQRIQGLIDGLEAAHRKVPAAIQGISQEEAHEMPGDGEWTVV